MSIESNEPGEKSEKIYDAQWARREDVLEAMIEILKNPDPSVKKLVDVIESRFFEAGQPLSKHRAYKSITQSYQLRHKEFLVRHRADGIPYLHEEDRQRLLDDLEKQIAWVRSRKQ